VNSPPTRSEEIEERLARLDAIEEIRQLRARYLRFLGTGDWDALRRLFADHAEFTLVEDLVVGSTDEFIEQLQVRLAGYSVPEVQYGQFPEIELMGSDTARGIWAAPSSSFAGDGPAGGVRYVVEEYHREAGVWKIARCELPPCLELGERAGDRAAISDLNARYNLAADGGDVDGYLATWSNGASFKIETSKGMRVVEGVEALAAVVAGRERGETVHITADAIVEFSGNDAASQRSTLVHFRRRPGDVALTIGRYEDLLVRVDGIWLYLLRHVILDDSNVGVLARPQER
jgi:hypothetical protein